MNHTRLFLLLQALGFLTAALVHAGFLAQGYQHRAAMAAETVIGVVLVLGWLAGLPAPVWSRAFALGVQGFALLGTLVGIFTMAIGVGPQSAFDVALHAGFVALLIAGLILTARAPHLHHRV